ncbi:hypothetical protein DM02DRAFT_473743, partial [Periconia macrospinosa]
PSSRFICLHPNCSKTFKRIEHMKRHFLTHAGERPFRCILCKGDKRFGRKDNYKEHYATH